MFSVCLFKYDLRWMPWAALYPSIPRLIMALAQRSLNKYIFCENMKFDFEMVVFLFAFHSVAVLTESLFTADEDNEQNAAPIIYISFNCYAIRIPFKLWLGKYDNK